MTRPPARPAPGYEAADAPPKAVAFALLGVFALIALSAAFVFAVFSGLMALHRPPPVTALERAALPPPPPRLETAPGETLARVRAAEQARLAGYGWSDRAAGLARIPIERAMQLQAERGWPDAQGSAP